MDPYDIMKQQAHFSNSGTMLYLYGFHSHTVQKGWFCPPHLHHKMFEINIAVDGQQASIINNKVFLNQLPGDLLLISPMQLHEYKVQNTETMSYLVFHIQIEDPDFLLLLEERNQILYPRDSPLNQQLLPVIRTLFQAMLNKASLITVAHLITQILQILELALMKEEKRSMNTRDQAYASQIAKAIEKITIPDMGSDQEGLKEGIELVAVQLGLSLRQCNRIFHKIYHMSPSQYWSALRKQEAMHLLLTSVYSIEQIAFMIKYKDVQSFSRQFRKWTGLSPTKFKLAYANEAFYLGTSPN